MAAMAGAASEPGPPKPLWTRAFILVCASTLACYSCQYFLVPVLPLFVKESGSSTFVAGLFFGAFSVTSFIVRPFIGKLTDTWSIGGVLMIGSLILGACGLAFLIPVLAFSFVVNTVRGIGWAAINTATSTAVATAAPKERRGEASGAYSVANTLGAGLAPAASLWLFQNTHGFAASFIIGGAFGLVSALILRYLPPLGAEAERGRGPFTIRGSGFSFDTFVDRRVLLASFLLLSVTTTNTVAIAFVPLHALSIGIENIGLYFLVNSAVAIAARVLLGRWLDRGPRGAWVAVGLALGITAFSLLSFSSTIVGFVVAGFVNSLALALTQPSMMAIAIDRADPAHMGRAMATYSMFYRVGEAIGAPTAGLLVDHVGFQGMYYGAVLSLCLGLVGTFVNWNKLRRPQGAGAA